MPAEPPVLATERTALAWQRSALSLAAIAGVMLAHALRESERLGLVAAAVPAVGAAWVQLRGRALYARRSGGRRGAARRSLRVLTVLTLAVAVLSAAVAAGSR